MKLKEKINGKKLKVISDLHYGHENVIRFGSRPFSNVKEMNNHIKEELKTKLEPGDILLDLGDLFWKAKDEDIREVLSIIPKNVKIFKCMGNHDKEGVYSNKEQFEYVTDLLEFNVDYDNSIYRIMACHYPMISWNHKPRASFMLFGHTHGNIDKFCESRPDLCVDCGFDASLSKVVGSPVIPFSAILKFMKEKAEKKGYQDLQEYVKNICTEL